MQEYDESLIFNDFVENPVDLSDRMHTKLCKSIETYMNETRIYMSDTKLDRHKLAACICAAIIKERPLYQYPDAKNDRFQKPNECLAVFCAIKTMRPFMITDFLKKYPEYANIRKELTTEYNFIFPQDKIGDKKDYFENLLAAVERAYVCVCKNKGDDEKCDKFDIWAYAKIFYHLELINYKGMLAYCQGNIKKTSANPSVFV
jgi:hypothetical protein